MRPGAHAPARRGLAVLALAAFLAGCFSERQATTGPSNDDPCAAATPPAGTVLIRNYAFFPAEVTVTRGSNVTWVNCDNDFHTSTADGGLWTSSLLGQNQTFTRTFTATGRFTYFCVPHPTMRGAIVVQ